MIVRKVFWGPVLAFVSCAGPWFVDVGDSPFAAADFSVAALESGGLALVWVETDAPLELPSDYEFATQLAQGIAKKLPAVRLLDWTQTINKLEKASLIADALAVGETPPDVWREYGEALGARYLWLASLSDVRTRTRGVWGVEVRGEARAVVHKRTSTSAGAEAAVVDAHSGAIVWQVDLEHRKTRTSKPLTRSEGPMRPGMLEEPKLKYDNFVKGAAKAIVDRLAKAAKR